MLDVAQAQTIVLRHCHPLPPEIAPLTSAAQGLVLAEDVTSDLDMPPHDKAMMDGYAIRASDVSGGGRNFTITEEITAGRTPTRPVLAGEAARIMTGAPIPNGADAVVMVEQTRTLESGRVAIDAMAIQPGQNILTRGREMRCGETVLGVGAVLRPQEFGLLATVGRTSVRVHPAPRVALLSTGDELVEAGELPRAGQIRNGNGPMLAAQITRAGGLPRYQGIARDDPVSLRALVAEGMMANVFILSGGVSAGNKDFVPGVLQELGVEAHFHKIALKPGKPLFFGTRGQTLVFGLPGNPVSALVCFELFVRPAIRRLRGHADAGPALVAAHLTEACTYRTDRPTYHPAYLSAASSGWEVRIVPWFGSPDLRALTRANSLAVLPTGDNQFTVGQELPVIRMDE